MKKLIYILLSLYSCSLFAQISPVPASYSCDDVIFSESFEAGIPAGWSNLNLDAVKLMSINDGWVIDRDTTFTTGTGPSGAENGDFYAYCDGSGPIARDLEVFLTTPSISIG